MNSGNSGSLQSSSGGDEEYDSRAADSFLMNTHSPPYLRPMSNAPPPPLFNPLSNYIQLQNPSASPWPRPASTRSDPHSPPSHHAPIIFRTPAAAAAAAAAAGESHDHLGAARNPRKRSRPSRRAPATVMTTDTTNFRAMVQEFTGIPSPPFNTSSFSSFGSEAPPPPYLRRSSTVASSSIFPIKYQVPITQNWNLFNVQNPNSLSSLLHSSPRFVFPSSDAVASKPHDEDSFGIPTASEFDDFGSSLYQNHTFTTLRELPNLVSPDEIKTAAVGGRGPENMAARREGMVESWICSSE